MSNNKEYHKKYSAKYYTNTANKEKIRARSREYAKVHYIAPSDRISKIKLRQAIDEEIETYKVGNKNWRFALHSEAMSSIRALENLKCKLNLGGDKNESGRTSPI